MKPCPGCRYLIGVKPRKRSLKPVKVSHEGDQEFSMQVMLGKVLSEKGHQTRYLLWLQGPLEYFSKHLDQQELGWRQPD